MTILTNCNTNDHIDQNMVSLFNEDNLLTFFKKFKNSKYDVFLEKLNIQIGVDGISIETFEKELDKNFKSICKRIKNGSYIFSPLREIIISKDPNLNLNQAKEQNKTRILSIATIKDTLVQKVIYESILEYSEVQFKKINSLDNISFSYRPNKSAPKAAQLIFTYLKSSNYKFAIDADLSKFFDTIPHDKLMEAIKTFFGEDNKLLIKYLYRFIKTDRCEAENYKKIETFYTKKPKRTKRDKGIPQGGVLSGLIANIYLHEFDKWVYKSYKTKISYVRYADDFIILFKNQSDIEYIFKSIESELFKIGLTIHPIGEKTKQIDLKVENINFVGFEISTRFIRAKKNNIIKFKNRIYNHLKEIKYEGDFISYLKSIIKFINFKILGNEGFNQICEFCCNKYPLRSWLKFFLNITDIRQLKSIDIWIKNLICKKVYNEVNKKIKPNKLKEYDLVSLEQEYYRNRKKRLKDKEEFCNCKIF